jgi:sterol desaturase/sphingolipid hydroxylase (fatty acid hydroxylase superfamily)
MVEGNATNLLTKLAVVGSYPAIMALVFVLYVTYIDWGWSVTLASGVSVLIGAALITLHETKLPFRAEWRPNSGDVTADAVYMITVQVELPFLLSISVVLALAEYLKASGYTVENIWPHDLQVAAQVCLMLLVADFLRYWLHRILHKYMLFWRFHAVHHSPHNLYWLNAGRYHPLEKAAQYVVDAMPFALMGVASEVLAAHFVFHVVNRFFQHSNCRVRLGPLNYIISGPELHRWHHSEFWKETNTNFGDDLIIWDLLFGTRFLPADREVGPLGLVNRDYPMDFLTQMLSPFIPGLKTR